MITPWLWGGTTSIEVLVKYNSFNEWSWVFDFGDGAGSNYVALCNEKTSYAILWAIYQGSEGRGIQTSNFGTSTWTYIVATVKDTTMKIYKNGILVGTRTDGHEPKIMTRTQHWLGRPGWADDLAYFNGTIAYPKIWHGVELTDPNVSILPLFESCTTPGHFIDMTTLSSEPCLAGYYSPGKFTCLPCPEGFIAPYQGMPSCSACPKNMLAAGTFCIDTTRQMGEWRRRRRRKLASLQRHRSS